MRSFLHELTVLAAVTAACGYVLVRGVSLSTPLPAPTLPPLVVAQAAMPWDDAMDVLRSAPEFASAAVGYAGLVPTSVVAWLTIVSQPRADSLFLDLLETSTLAGQMYALAGLRVTSPRLFHIRAQPLWQSRALVNTLIGCTGSGMTTAVLILELERGTWTDEFLRASRSRYFGDLPWPRSD